MTTLLRTLCIVALAVPTVAEGLFEDLSIYDALSKAGRSNRVVLVSWTRPDDPQCRRMNQIWGDSDVAQWIERYAVAVQVDGEAEPRQALNWNIGQFPTTMLIKSNGSAIMRVVGAKTAKQFVIEADAALQGDRAGAKAKLEAPSGEQASDPLAWLDYANALFSRGKPAAGECLDAYLWCIDNGDAQSPGFLDTYLDLIVQRVLSMDRIAPARSQLRQRRDGFSRALAEGYGTPSSLRSLMRISRLLKDDSDAVKAYQIVTGSPDPDPAMVEIATDGILPIMVGRKRYEEALEHAGDILTRAGRAAELLGATLDGKQAGAGASASSEARRVFLDRYGNYYEALLGVGRGGDARQLAELVISAVPTGNACSTFIRHARRLEYQKVAEQLAEFGHEHVSSAKGRKMIAKALKARNPGFSRYSQDKADEVLQDGLQNQPKLGKNKKK